MVTQELFELEMLGGAMERRYRTKRPEVEQMPWGTLDPHAYPRNVVDAARRSWTRAAFQEHRTGAACAAALRALIEARAPVDLVALATRFPLDEVVHVELCSRMAMELGGGTEIWYDPNQIVLHPREDLDVVMRCADLVVRFFCVGESLSIPMLHGTWRTAEHPLPRAVLGRIVRDEAAHGAFGWSFLDWTSDMLDDEDRALLADAADETIAEVKKNWEDIRKRPAATANVVHSLGWMQSDAYLDLAVRSLERKVLEPLRRRNIPVQSTATLD